MSAVCKTAPKPLYLLVCMADFAVYFEQSGAVPREVGLVGLNDRGELNEICLQSLSAYSDCAHPRSDVKADFQGLFQLLRLVAKGGSNCVCLAL